MELYQQRWTSRNKNRLRNKFVYKNIYDWNFLELEEEHTEKDLEQALINSIEKVLLEFGNGFAFMARQQKVLINNKWKEIDLLFYHNNRIINFELSLKYPPAYSLRNLVEYSNWYHRHEIHKRRQ